MLIAIFYLLGIVVGGIAALSTNGSASAEMLQWFFLLGVGVPLVISGLGHLFRGELAARRLGWDPGSPFQKELGVWDLAGGVVGILAFWRHGGFWRAALIAHCIFWLGAGCIHVAEISRRRNLRADNLLPALCDFLVPATLLLLFLAAT